MKWLKTVQIEVVAVVAAATAVLAGLRSWTKEIGASDMDMDMDIALWSANAV